MQNNDPRLRRTHKLVITFNDYEAEAFDKYCRKFKIGKNVKIAREIIMTRVLAEMERNYPTLFDKDELARLEQ